VVDPTVYNDVAIGADGTVTARRADTGVLEEVAQLALARFPNPGGLNREGNGLFAPSPNAGDVVMSTPGDQGLGTLQAGTLEMSNVDLAQEFTNLILAQRGFQANARTITTSDELLQELVNLKR
jgi:flagellar hook protein FlgE